MGRTITPKYRLEASYISFTNKRADIMSQVWDKSYGKPTLDNVIKFRKEFNDSLKLGGVNQHLQNSMSPIGTIRIIEQKTNQEIVKFVPPTFEVI